MTQSHYPATPLLINGIEIHAHERPGQAIVNPATGTSLGNLPHATKEDLDAALNAAHVAFTSWRTTSPQRRGQIMADAARLLRERADAISELVTLEVGKPRPQGWKEAIIAAETLEWFAEEGKRVCGRIHPGDHEGVKFSVLRSPIGVVVGLETWNFPVINAARKIGAALGAGGTCVYKPDEEAPASGFAVARALMDAGLPAGVVGIVNPAEVSSHLLASPIVRKLSFTGSVPVGRHLMKLAAERSIRTTMELGGHAPVIVCDDVDIEDVAKQAVASKFRNAGQVCVAPTRFLVAKKKYAEFVEAFARHTRGMRVGDAANEGVDMGPLIHERRRIAVHEMVLDAVNHGAELVVGGSAIAGNGFFYQPTVLANVPLTARVMSEEPFGPVALINSFDKIEQAIDEANRLSLGLAAYAFSASFKNVCAIRDGVEAGMLGINSFVISRVDAPFSGVKDSGHGAENGVEGIQDYLVVKSVSERNASV